MPRLARLVVPGYPHHITQRGVRSMEIFVDDRNRLSYLQFLSGTGTGDSILNEQAVTNKP